MKRAIILFLAAFPLACIVKAEPTTGEQGPEGPSGKAGMDGAKGQPGQDGMDGTTGMDGMDGMDGPAGKEGADGLPGVSPFTYVDPNAMTDIYYTGGKVGIGTATPAESLDVKGGLHVSGAISTSWHVTHTAWKELLAPQGPFQEGYWKLVTPIPSNQENMFTIRITMFRYPLGSVVNAQCGGYAYPGFGNPNSAGLIAAGCRLDGSADPVGIGEENDKVVLTLGSKGYPPWYADKVTFEYVGQTPQKGEDFQWEWVYQGISPYPNHNKVLIDDANGIVGIGTVTPQTALDVAGTIRASADVQPYGYSQTETVNVRAFFTKQAANALCNSGFASYVPWKFRGKTGNAICAADANSAKVCTAVKHVSITAANTVIPNQLADPPCSEALPNPWPWGLDYDLPSTLDGEYSHGDTRVVCCN